MKKTVDEKRVKREKIATALIHENAIIELLKVPFGMELLKLEYPVDGKVKITVKGDKLPVKVSAVNTKQYPEIKYTIMRHWHQAKIEPMTKESNNEKI